MVTNMDTGGTLFKFTVFLVFTTLLLMVVGQELDPEKMYKMCQQKSNATDDELSSFLKSQSIPTTEHGKCLLACIFENTGVLTKEGKYNADGIYEMAKRSYDKSPEQLVKAKKVVDTCAKEVEDSVNKCEAAVKAANCTMVVSQKVGLGSA
uniref:Odorant-binding protein 38 n=1 Tax=Matsumurasca onukii TaxID=2912585 RepID=A0A343WGX8_MATON|nr:odorant-binding protein 38 [Matsumurasca onukii]